MEEGLTIGLAISDLASHKAMQRSVRFLHMLSAFLLMCLSETAAPLTTEAAVKAVPWGPPLPVMAASAKASEAVASRE
jgi:hypothetical protein